MSSFFKKLKNLANLEEETEEKVEEESFQKGLESEESTEPDKSKQKPPKDPALILRVGPTGQTKKIKTIKAEEKFVEPQREIPKEIKTEKRKWPEPEGQLAVDVYQTDGELVIQSTIAGVKPEDLDIAAQGDMVTIRGKRENIEKEEKNYFYQECYWGPFSREIILPVEADTSRAEATMVDGILTIRMPKIEKEKKKKIIIK